MIYSDNIIDAKNIEKNEMKTHLTNQNTIASPMMPNFGTSINASFNDNNNDFITSMSGEKISKEDFTHGNMTPFFGSKIMQNVDVYRTESTLDRHTGVSKLDKPKSEVLEKMNKRKDNVFRKRFDYENRARYAPSMYKQGVPLQEPLNVGPGLNAGFTTAPSGGFQQPDAREYAIKRGIDQLRVKTNPKVTYEARHVDGFKGSRRGLQAAVNQNCVVRVHDWGDIRLNPKADNNKAKVRVQHVSAVKKFGPKEVTLFGGLTRSVKGLTQSLVDKVRETIKHQTIYESIGYVSDKNKSIAYYDPNDTTRVTKRETTEQNHTEGMIGNTAHNTGYRKTEDEMKTTRYQTTLKDADGSDGNIMGDTKLYSTLDDDAKVTKSEISMSEYTGGALSVNKQSTNYEDIYNASLNELKEGISKGRSPTKTSIKVAGDSDHLGIMELSQEQENKYLAPASDSKTNLDSSNFPINDNKKDVLADDRLDTSILEQLRENEYEHILHDIANDIDNKDKKVTFDVTENTSC